ncbi:hypothetical protein GCM10027419_12230 [Pandoraea terrae]
MTQAVILAGAGLGRAARPAFVPVHADNGQKKAGTMAPAELGTLNVKNKEEMEAGTALP